MQVAAFYLGAASVLGAEAIAMRNDIMKAAAEAYFTDIHIEIDNKILIQAVQGYIRAPWEIRVLLQDIHTYIQLYNNVHITHIFRQWNCAADWLAKYGLSLHSTVM